MKRGSGRLTINLTGSVSGSAVGSFGFSDVYGLATTDDGILYGVANTSVFSVNPTTGAGTLVSNYGGQGLGASYGSSFYTESGATVPDQASTLSLLSGAFLVVGLLSRRK